MLQILFNLFALNAFTKRLEELNKFNAIEVDHETKDVNIARVMTNDEASGKKIVGHLGTKDNWLEWRRVNRKKGGKYTLTIKYKSEQPANAELLVNGKRYYLKNLICNGQIQSVDVSIKLKKGENLIRIGNEKGKAPDIDLIELTKK